MSARDAGAAGRAASSDEEEEEGKDGSGGDVGKDEKGVAKKGKRAGLGSKRRAAGGKAAADDDDDDDTAEGKKTRSRPGKKRGKAAAASAEATESPSRATTRSASAKRRRHRSDSSNYDPELEREIGRLGKLRPAKRAKKAKGGDDDDDDDDDDEEAAAAAAARRKSQKSAALKSKEVKKEPGDEEDEGDEEEEVEGEEGKKSRLRRKARKERVKKEKVDKLSVTSADEEEEEEGDEGEEGEEDESDASAQRIKTIVDSVTDAKAGGQHFSDDEDDGGEEVKEGPDAASEESDDSPENRIAKSMLLQEIMVGKLSGEDSSSEEDDDKEDEQAAGKKRSKGGGSGDGAEEEEGDGDDGDDGGGGSDSDFEIPSKSRFRHHLLRHKLVESDSDSARARKGAKKGKEEGDEEDDDDDEERTPKKPRRKPNRGINTADSDDDSDDDDEGEESSGSLRKSELDGTTSDSQSDSKKKKSYKTRSSKKVGEEETQRSYKQKKKRRRIKVQESSSDENSDESERKRKRRRKKKRKGSEDEGSTDEEDDSDDDDSKSPGKGRKKIRKIIKDTKLRDETQQALKEEEERRRRVAEREKERDKLREVIVIEDEAIAPCPITTKLVLEEDPETHEPVVEVLRSLVCKLKPHQVDGVQFMWDCCIETVKKAKKEPGSGCILAHCMGLGKTLQVVTLLHTVLTNKKLDFDTALVVCPLNTVLNWQNEFNLWLGNLEEDELEVWELTTVKRVQDRVRLLQEWHESGGIMIMGYEMYRNLTQGRHVKSKKQREVFERTLVNPGPDFVICDEGHILKNENSAISKAMNAIGTRRRVVLTGTPLQNNLMEYHCMVNFIKENLLGSSKEFRNRFINPIQNGQCSDSTLADVRLMKKRAHILYELLAGCVQRKDYTALTKFLPPKHEYVLSIRLTPLQCILYQHYLDHFTGAGMMGEQGRGRCGTKLFADYQMLCRIWTHPWCLHLDYISKENKGFYDEDSMDDFIATSEDEKASMSGLGSDSEPTTSRRKGKKGAGKGGDGGAGGGPSGGNDRRGSGGRSSDSDAVEVVKVWNTRSRRGAGNTRPDDDVPAAAAVVTPKVEKVEENDAKGTAEWFKEFVKEEEAEVMAHSGKLTLLFETLAMAEELCEKVLVFSQSLISLDLIEDFLEMANKAKAAKKPSPYKGKGKWFRNVDYYRMDGSTSASLRKKWAEDFNDESNPRGRLFLISTKAGSLGINLVAANRVIVFDASWNPSYDIQSIFRVYRFGQMRPVFVYRFLAQGTMEEKIYDRQVTKESLSFRVVDQQQVERHFTMNELSELYTFEPERLDEPNKKKKRPTPRLPKDKILAEMLQNNRDQIVEYHEHDSLLDHKEEEALTEEERKAAWTEYEAEKKGLNLNAKVNSAQSMSTSLAMWRMDYAQSLLTASPQQLQEMLNTSRAQVADAHTRLAQNKLDSAEEILRRVRNTNPTLNESQVLEVCQLVQRNQQADRRRFEGNYQELLARHQMIFQAYQSLAQQTAQLQAQAMLQQQQHQQQQLLTMQAAAAYRPHTGGLHGLLQQQQQQQRGGIGVGGAMPGSSSGAGPQTGDGSQQEPILL